MKLEDWEKKLIANNLDSDSIKRFRSQICKAQGFRSVADIPSDMADDLICMISNYVEIMTEAALNGG